MKRPFDPKQNYHAKFGNIKSDFTPEQLIGIGAVAMSYNEMEAELFSLFIFATNMKSPVQLEVYSRINGTVGVTEIINKGAAALDMGIEIQRALEDALGNGGFGQLKTYRDAVIHARMHNAPLGVGLKLDRRANLIEVLLTKEALEILYEHNCAMTDALRAAVQLLVVSGHVKRTDLSDPDRRSHAAIKAMHSAQFLEHRKRQQSLRPLPEFPSELELLEAQKNWLQERIAAQMEWSTQQVQPVMIPASPAMSHLTDPPVGE